MPALLLLLLAAPGDPEYETIVLSHVNRADTLMAPDLNGDSHPDLVIQEGRDLHLFLFDPSKGLQPRPSQTLRLGGTVFLWTSAKLEKNQPPALLTAGSRALRAHPFDGRAFKTEGIDLVVHPSIFEDPPDPTKPPRRIDFAPDLDGDGASELLLFTRERILVMRRHGKADYRCEHKLPVSAATGLMMNWAAQQRLIEAASLPILSLGDFDGDGLTDLVTYREETLTVFRQSKDGRFLDGTSYDLAAKKRKPRRRFLKFEIPPRVMDFNNDGLLDVALVYPSKGRAHITYGRPGRRDFTQPDEIKQAADAWSTGAYLRDLDRDGDLDLILGVVRKFGISEGIQAFLSGRVDLELHIYPMRETGRFTKDPVQELKFSIPYSFHVTRTSAMLDLVFRPNFEGDYDGDGRNDLLVADGPNLLRVYPGDPEKGIADQPKASIAMNPPAGTANTEPFVADLNRDGISDLVLKHVLVESGRHVLEVKLSK